MIKLYWHEPKLISENIINYYEYLYTLEIDETTRNGAAFILKMENSKYVSPVKINIDCGKSHKKYELDISNCLSFEVVDFIKEDIENKLGELIKKESNELFLKAFNNYKNEKMSMNHNNLEGEKHKDMTIYGVFGDTPRTDKDNIDSLWIDKTNANGRKRYMEEMDTWNSYHLEKLEIDDFDIDKLVLQRIKEITFKKNNEVKTLEDLVNFLTSKELEETIEDDKEI